MIVDDEAANLRMLERLFRNDYEVITASSGQEALDLLNRFDVAVIISDQRMPGMSGIEFLKRAAVVRSQTVRIILTGYTDVRDLVEALNSRVVYKYITKPWINSDLAQNVRRAFEHYEANKTQHMLGQLNERLELRLLTSVQGIVKVIREMISMKRPDLSDHCRRTANYAALIGERMSLGPDDMESLIFAALLHEFPHLRLPIEIDTAALGLNIDKRTELHNRFESALNLVSNLPDLHDVETIIRYQHERYDGLGLFSGLDRDKIPIGSRILAAANTVDEIQSGRRPELYCTDEETVECLQESSGASLDPEIVEICLEMEFFKPVEIHPLTRTTPQTNFVGVGL